MKKEIKYGGEAREALYNGIEKLTNAVRITLGGEGRNVVFGQQFGAPETSRDGVTVAREFDLSDKFEKLGSDMLRKVALKTNDDVGDGTTTAIIVAKEIIKSGFGEIKLGYSPVKLSRELKEEIEKIVAQLKTGSKKITTQEQMAQIGIIASRDPEIGKLVAGVVHEAGENGVIDVQDSKGIETTKEVVKGLRLDKGYVSPYLVTDGERMVAEYHDLNILITDKKISDLDELLPLIEKLGRKGLMIVADDIDGYALTALIMNHLGPQQMRYLAIKAPGFGDNKRDILNDLAVITGGTLISEDTGIGLKDVTEDMLGKADRIISTKSYTNIVGGAGSKKKIEERINQLKTEFDLTEAKYDKDNIKKRLAGLTGGIAVIKVGASSEVEQKEKKYLVEDAVSAVTAAVSEGIIEGGGIPLLRIVQSMKPDTPANRVLINALSAPFKQIIENGGEDYHEILSQIKAKEFKVGYDVVNREVGDMFRMGIIDPLKVTKTALLNAVSVASTVLITETIIAIEEEKEKMVIAPPQM